MRCGLFAVILFLTYVQARQQIHSRTQSLLFSVEIPL